MYKDIDIVSWMIHGDRTELHKKDNENMGILKLMRVLYYAQ